MWMMENYVKPSSFSTEKAKPDIYVLGVEIQSPLTFQEYSQ